MRGVAHEPGIAEILCGAGLTGGDLVLEAGAGAGTTPHVGLEHLVHEAGALDRDRSFRSGRIFEDDRAVAVLDSLDEDGIDLESVVGEGGVRRCHLQRGDVLRAERHRDRQIREVGGDTERLGGLGNVRQSDGQAESKIRTVRRCEGLRAKRCNRTTFGTAEIVGLVRVRETARVVELAGADAVDLIGGHEALLEGRGEHERLER